MDGTIGSGEELSSQLEAVGTASKGPLTLAWLPLSPRLLPSFQEGCGLYHIPAGDMDSHQAITLNPLCLELCIQEHDSKDYIVIWLHTPALRTRISRSDEVCDPAITLLGAHGRELRTHTYKCDRQHYS